MDRLAPLNPRRRRPGMTLLATLAATAALAAGWAGIVPTAGAAPTPPAAALPPDFPADVPLPPGQLQGSTGGAGQWSVLLLVDGSAPAAHSATVAFYRARGFVAETDSVLHNAAHRVTIVVANRDHSPNQTFIAIGVGPATPAATPAPAPGTPAPSSARIALATRLAGHGRGSATVTITGARVCWTIRNLHGVGRPRGATIRQGASGRSGPVMVRLGRRYRASGCTAIPAALGQSIAARPRGFYVAVTTRAHPRGAVRGQLRPA
jgi:hypothetical protein